MNENYKIYPHSLPYLTTEQMIEVDRAMIEDYGIDLIQMMVNAGRNLANLARSRFLNGDPRGKHVIVLAGTGGNGGGALVAARRLSNYGAQVEIVLTKTPANFRPVPAHQLSILSKMFVTLLDATRLDQTQQADLVLDGIIGYSLSGPPRGLAADLIRWANDQTAPVLALDVPSGLDATQATVYDPTIRATATLTLALPKVAFRNPASVGVTGELYLADIGVPPQLYAQPPLNLTLGPIFAQSDILRLT